MNSRLPGRLLAFMAFAFAHTAGDGEGRHHLAHDLARRYAFIGGRQEHGACRQGSSPRRGKPPKVVSKDWKLTRQHDFSNGTGAFLHPIDGQVYVARCLRENYDKRVADAEELGLFRIGDSGRAEKFYSRFFISSAVPHPVTGDLFLNYPNLRAFKRLSYGTWEETNWASDLRSNDVDCCGYAMAPVDYQGKVTKPLHVLVADRGHDGPKEILGFSGESAQTDRARIHRDEGKLMDPVDVAISRMEVFVADTSGGGAGAGRIFRLLPEGKLEQLMPQGLIGRPCGLAVKADNSQLYIADMQENRILQLDLESMELTELVRGLSLSRSKDFPYLVAGCVRLSADERVLVITDRGSGAIYLVERRP